MKCPKCNTPMEWDGAVRTSNPPMYMHKCPKCGHCEFLFSVENENEMTAEEIRQILGHDPLTFEQMKELQQMELQHDWEKVRNQAAIAAMQGMLSNSFDHELMTPDNVAKQSVKYADALVKELRGKEE